MNLATTRSVFWSCSLIAYSLLPTCDLAAQQSQSAAAGTPQAASTVSNTTQSLQNATQNPVADLVSVPFQNNGGYGAGLYNRSQNVLLIEPVIPIHLSKDWILINRTIQPVVWQPYSQQTTGGEFGFGDMNPQFYLSPAKPGKLIWGVGPQFVLPTATNNILGQGKVSIGPAVVALTQPHPWTIGALANNLWSIAGSGSRPSVNQFLLEYFINYNMKKGWYIDIAPVITADWKASSGNIWTVPVGGGLARLMKVGFQPLSIAGQLYGNAVHPQGASSWSMRFQVTLLFPQLSTKEKETLMEEKLKEMEAEQSKKK